MKILHIINSLQVGGAETLLLHVSTELISRGHAVDVLVLEEGNPIIEERFSRNNIRVIHLHKKRYLSIREFLKAIRGSDQYDICHTHLYPALLYGWIAKLLGLVTKLIHTEHNTTNNRRKWYFWAFETALYSQMDAVICISGGVKEALDNWLPNSKNKSTVIWNAIAPSRKKEDYSRNSSRVLRFLSVGRLVKDKNFELQLKMLAIVDGVSIDIAGDGPLKRELQILAETLNVSDRVRFLGNVADMVNLYQQYDAYIHTATLEGFGLVVGEAMSAGLPVIVPYLPGIEEVAGDSSLFFGSNNLSELCKKVILIKDMSQNDYSSLCIGSLQRSNYFGIDQHVSKLETLYRGIP